MGLKIRKDGAWVNVSSKTSGSITAMASGAISAGDPVVLNSDGTVSKVSIATRITKLEEGPSTPYNGSNSQYDTYSWTVEDGITELSVVCIGGGGGGGGARDHYGGGGAGLGHIIMDVTPGDVIEYQVGAGGEGGYWMIHPNPAPLGQDGGDTWLKNGSGTKVVSGGGGEGGGEGGSSDNYNGEGGTYIGDGGGSGGDGGNMELVADNENGAGGGGAGGYAGNGGAGGDGEASTLAGRDGYAAATGSGGGGGGAADAEGYDYGGGGGGGGTGILGKGSDGAGGEAAAEGGYGGEGGSWTGEEGDGQQGGEAGAGNNKGGYGGYYGGGGGKAGGFFSDSPTKYGGDGGRGAIRIVGSGSNLTATNFLGFSEADYANNDTAAITIFSSIDKNQSGLLQVGKKYYVQDDGTLSTTPGDIRVEAGTALSSTNILVSGGAALKLEGTTRPFNTSGWKIPLVG